jgi:hypothetical protein
MPVPEWFNVSNYDCCEKWGIHEWCRAIETRLTFRNWPAEFANDPPEATEFDGQIDLNFSKNLADKNFLALTVIDLHKDPAFSRVLKNVKTTDSIPPFIFPVNMEYLGVLHQELIEPLEQAEKDALHRVDGNSAYESLGNHAVDEVMREKHKEHFDHSTIAIIDLTAPDEVLQDQFINFIHERRSLLGVNSNKKIPSDVQFRSWHANRILGFFDLTWWAELTGDKLTNEQIGAALFPDELTVEITDRIRKVVKPAAAKAFRTATVTALRRLPPE